MVSVAVAACSSAPRVSAAPPPQPAAECASCCGDSIFVAEVDPASTLDFHPSHCRLDLAGWYAIDQALLDPRHVDIFLFCEQHGGSENSLAIRYNGAPVDDTPLTGLADPYHTGGREKVTTVSYAFGGPHNHGRYRFEAGEVRFHRPPRARLEHDGSRGNHVELGVDLRFEGERRFRAALRICPTYADTGPVSDPVN